MKNPLKVFILPAAIVTIAALTGASAQNGESCCGNVIAVQHGTKHPEKAFKAKQFKNKQTATVVINGGYSPAVIEVRKGKPVELTFKAGKNLGCGGTLVFESLKIRKEIAVGKSVVVKFTPSKKGEVHFTCGMGMYRGHVSVK